MPYESPKNNKTYKGDKLYPNIKISLLIIAVSLLLTFLIVLFLNYYLKKEFNEAVKTILTSSLTSLLMYFSVYFFIRRKYADPFKGLFKKNVNYGFLYSIIPAVIGTMMLNIVINSLLPKNDSSAYRDFLLLMASEKSYIFLFMIPTVILAPLTEELIFRGFLLRGISSNHKPLISILVTSSIFSLIHLNSEQIPNAFILGVIFSVITIHSGNLKYTMIYHALNNFYATFLLFFVSPSDLMSVKIQTQTENINGLKIFIFTIVGLIFIYIGLKLTIKKITGENRSVIPKKKVYQDYLKECE